MEGEEYRYISIGDRVLLQKLHDNLKNELEQITDPNKKAKMTEICQSVLAFPRPVPSKEDMISRLQQITEKLKTVNATEQELALLDDVVRLFHEIFQMRGYCDDDFKKTEEI